MEDFEVKSIKRAAEVLKVLSNGTSRLSDVSEKLNLSNSTTHRLLKTLETTGLVAQDPFNRQYHLGHLIVTLAANPLIAHANLVACAYQQMRHLQEFSHETVTLHIKLGCERIRLQALYSDQYISYIGRPNVADPLYAGAMGKVLLSELNLDELSSILNNVNLIKFTPTTITDKGVLLEELKKVREQGFATSYSETVADLAAVSVPIRSYAQPVALSIMGPDYRFASHMLDLVEEMKKCSARISRSLLSKTKRKP